ncbi:hypothetical protein BASA81_008903 [Batrachochytrium salamandrivorans]|nr:hypothetical protein BASA81_008903 [Batrachochytrium salamandrivorans]
MLSRVLISSARASQRSTLSAFSQNAMLFSTDAPASPSSSDEQEIEISVPKNFVRFIIGPKGANAQKLTEASGGATLKFQKEVAANGKDEIGRIFGTAEQVAEMKRLIEEDLAKLESDPLASSSKSGGDYVEEIVVDAQYVGFLIGKAGALLKEMEASSGARVRYSDADFSKSDRTARLTGTYEQVQDVKKQISDKLFERQEEHRTNPERFSRFAGNNNNASKERRPRFSESDLKQVVEVPSDIVGALIGKGGLALHRMQDDTGAKFDFAKDETRHGVKEVTIYGREEQIQNACDLLQSRVQEINSRNSRS